MFSCVSVDSMEYNGCRDNYVSLILKHHMIMCFYTLPQFAHFYIGCIHTLTLTCLSTYCHAYIILLILYALSCTICSFMSIWFLNYALNSVWCLIQQFYFGTNLLLIKFVYILCALFCGLCCSILQMAPRRTSAQHADKRKCMDVSLFLFTQHFE